MNEIKKHNNEDDCWIIIKNKVYDVTPYLQKQIHPGGDEVLLKYGGKMLLLILQIYIRMMLEKY